VIRCVIVDDNQSFLEAAAGVLRRDGITIVGTASTIDEALESVARDQPDVVLIDIRLGSESGFDLAVRLAQVGSAATMILISTHAEEDFADLVEASPAVGFLPKSELSAAAIRRLLPSVG
jgi:DNA-binding NarL/FixJ family response regulator